jgi:hypothetical protein
MEEITAEWALWGKRPGDRADYSVLDCSKGGFQASQFKEIINRFAPGNPDVPDALPRVTISWVGAGTDPYLGMAIQTWTSENDGVGRDIAQTRYFCVPYAQLHDHRVSYRDLYEAFKDLPLPADHGLARVEVPEFDPDRIAKDLGEYGFRAVLGVASTLLVPRRPVCVLRAEQISLEVRLRFLDAVAALLPYGYRTRFTASTWTNSASPHRIRLSFAKSPRDEAHPVTWKSPAQPPGKDQVAGQYFGLLDGLHTRRGAATTIRLLAAETTPRRFEEPQHALTSAKRIAGPYLALALVRDGGHDPDGVRELFDGDTPGIMALEPAERTEALIYLIKLAEAQDAARITRWTPIIGHQNPIPVVDALITAARKLMWATANARVSGYLTLATRLGHPDRFLAALMRPPERTDQLEGGLGQAAQLLHDHVIATEETRLYENTRAVLADNPAVVCALMIQLVQDKMPHLGIGLAWLVPQTPDLLHPFQVILKAAHPLDLPAIETLAAHGRSCLRAILKVASDRGRLHLVLDAFIAWLNDHSTLDPDDWHYWGRQFGDLSPADPHLRATVDVLLMVVGAAPTSMMHIYARDWPAYLEGFLAAWTRPWTGDNRTSLLPEFCKHLAGISWKAHPGRADHIVALIEQLIGVSAPNEGAHLGRSLAESLHTAPSLAADPHARNWLRDNGVEYTESPAALPQAPEVREPPPLPSPPPPEPAHIPKSPPVQQQGSPQERQLQPPGPTVRELAERIVRRLVKACLDDHGPELVCGSIAREGEIQNVPTAWTVIDLLPRALIDSGKDWEVASNWTDTLASHLCQARIGTEFAMATYRGVPEELLIRARLLDTVMRHVAGSAHALAPPDRTTLEKARKELDQVIKEVKSKAPKDRRWFPGGSTSAQHASSAQQTHRKAQDQQDAEPGG